MKAGLRGQPRWLSVGVLLIVMTALSSGRSAQAAPGVPSAPATSDGNYTVTPNGCNDSIASYMCLADWVEERILPNGAFAPTSGVFTGKPTGVYEYRTGDVYCDLYYSICETRYSSSVSVTVGDAPPRDPLDVQHLYTYRARIGNVIGDSGTDILVERMSGGEPGNGVVDAVILRQDALRAFTPIVPTITQRSSSAWAPSSLTIELEDVNVDGYVDLIVGNVDSAIAGADDQIVYSSGAPLNDTPKGIRALDASLAQFTGNMLDYMIDNDYFVNNAPIVGTLIFYSIPYCPPSYSDIYITACYPVYLYYYVFEPDYSVFDASAVDIWTRERALVQGTLSRSQAVNEISSRVADRIGVGIGGWDLDEIFGSTGPHDDPLWTKGLEAFISIIGIGTAHADEVETDEAPRQVERQPDVIYITGRYVFGTGTEKLHSSVYYQIPGVGVPTWLSAFDTDPSLLGDGKLIGQTNDLRDTPLLMRFTLGTVTPPSGFSSYSHFFADMVPAHERYRARPFESLVTYDAIPELPPCGGCAGRNSNGYVNGLIRATGGTAIPLPPLDFDDMFGWEYPVEPVYFGF